MKSFDPANLQRAELDFLAKPEDDRLLEQYYLSMVNAGEILLRAHLEDIGLVLDAERRTEVAHDAFTRLLEFHRRHPGQEVPAASRMFQEIRYQLHNRSAQRRNRREVQGIDDHMALPKLERPSADPQGNLVREISSDPAVDGRRVVVEIFDARQFKRALRRIAEFVPRPWLYQHVEQLRVIFDFTRGRR